MTIQSCSVAQGEVHSKVSAFAVATCNFQRTAIPTHTSVVHRPSALQYARFFHCKLLVARSGVTGVLPAPFQTSMPASSGRPSVFRVTSTFSIDGFLYDHVRSESP